MPATLAILSIVFIETVFSALGVTDKAGEIGHKLLSVLVLILINGANSISTKASTRLNNFFVVTKFLSIFAVVLAGIVVMILGTSNPDRDIGGKDWRTKPWLGFRDTVNPDGSRIDWSKLSEWDILGHYSAALYGALWAYSGWDKVSFKYLQLNEVELIFERRFTSQRNFLLRLVSFHSLSIQPSQPLYFVLLPQMQLTISSFRGV